ncbi:MAG: class I SAM-dependent methyltransferase [Myxococcota bacterium]
MDTQVDRVRELFDTWAQTGRAEGMEKGHTPTARPAFDRLEVSAEQHYLDIGCGNGYTVRWAAAIDPTVQAIGIDLSEEMVLRARSQTKADNARFIHAPFPLPLLKAKTFDAIFSMEVFYYLPDLPWALVSVGRLLKPGGRFACVVDYYEENPASHSWPEDVGVAMNRLSKVQWRDAMSEVGLEVIEQTQLCDPAAEGWKRDVGSLLTVAQRP